MPIKSLPQPCILVTAGLAVRKDEESGSSQMVLDVGLVEPPPVLRAIYVTANDAARDEGILIHRQWRVPAESVIARVFESGGSGQAVEDLSWWRTSGGCQLKPCQVLVKARKDWDSVVALVIPKI
jgi:hypothetical protein